MKILAINKRARYDYDIKEVLDAGLVLEGREVKSAKASNLSMAGSYVKVSATGASVINLYIGPYKYANNDGYDPSRTRQLLLSKRELNDLLGKEKGTSIVPMEVYIGRRGLIKLKIGIGRGRKKEDKREYIKKRDTEKQIRKEVFR